MTTTLLGLLLIIHSLSCGGTTDPPIVGADTTSHAFTWTVEYLGDGSGSRLNDVMIISDTLAYAVGEIYRKDSLGNWDYRAYNVARWDGISWKLGRVPFIGPCVAVQFPPIRAIWAFSETDIWLSNGGAVVYYDGTAAKVDCRMNTLLAGAINRICGTDHHNVYLAGDNGAIVRYDGSSWQQIPSGTTLNLTDIYGGTNTSTGAIEILAVGGEFLTSSARRIMQISGSTVNVLSDSGISSSLSGIWCDPGNHYVTVGSGIFEKHRLEEPRWSNGQLTITRYHTYGVRGVAANDVFVCGDFGEMLHYNGSSWMSFRTQTAISNGMYLSLSFKQNRVIAVGTDGTRAVVAVGRR